MTDIHKLHTDDIPSEEIIEKLNLGPGILYRVGCLMCSNLLDKYQNKNKPTIESLEKRIAELERELNDQSKQN